jgi:hypothetical protein
MCNHSAFGGGILSVYRSTTYDSLENYLGRGVYHGPNDFVSIFSTFYNLYNTGICGINYGSHTANKPLSVNNCTFNGDFYAIRTRTLFNITNNKFNVYTSAGKLAAVWTWGNGEAGTKMMAELTLLYLLAIQT